MLYFHSSESRGRRRACIAACVVEGNLQFGQAVCSDKDQYNRKLGRAIAGGRAIKTPMCSIPVMGRPVAKLFLKHAAALAEQQISKYERH